jgi:hypothetical protein
LTINDLLVFRYFCAKPFRLILPSFYKFRPLNKNPKSNSFFGMCFANNLFKQIFLYYFNSKYEQGRNL